MENGRHHDLADRVEDVVRSYILRKMPPDQSGELAGKPLRELQVIYGNWRGRLPTPRPRKAHWSKEMAGSAKVQEYASEIAELVRKIEAGEDLRPHLSERVETAYLSSAERASLPAHKRDEDRDLMLADWGVHHLHSSAVLAERGNDLLYAVFRRDDAYLVGMYTHQDWALDNVAEVVIHNWDGLGIFHRLHYAEGVHHLWAAEERSRLRKARKHGREDLQSYRGCVDKRGSDYQRRSLVAKAQTSGRRRA